MFLLQLLLGVMVLVLIVGTIFGDTKTIYHESQKIKELDRYEIKNIRMVTDYKKNVTFFVDYSVNGKEITRWVPTAKEVDTLIDRMERDGIVTWYGDTLDAE